MAAMWKRAEVGHGLVGDTVGCRTSTSSASHSRAAFSAMASMTICSSLGELAMTRKMLLVAASRSNALRS